MESTPLTAEQAEGLLAEYEALVEELADLKTEMEVRRLASRAKWDEERARVIAQDAVIRDLRAQLAEAQDAMRAARECAAPGEGLCNGCRILLTNALHWPDPPPEQGE